MALGERIVRELNIHPCDTLSSWLAHHIAELLLAEKNANDTDRPSIQLQTIETILKIWAQRQFLPGNVNPLNHLDRVLKKINLLDTAFPSLSQPTNLDDNLVMVWDLLRSLVIHFTIFELSEKADKVEYEGAESFLDAEELEILEIINKWLETIKLPNQGPEIILDDSEYKENKLEIGAEEEQSKVLLIQKIETTITTLNILKENLSEIPAD